MRTNTLTEGKITTTLIRFAIPFMIANLLQALYGAVDMAVVGQFASASGLSAVATGGELMSTINCLITGLTTGGTILIGQYAGAKRADEINQTIGTMFTFFAVISLVLSGVIFLLIDPILKAVQTPAPAYEQTKAYVLICSAGIILIFGYNAVSAVLRGMGDSKSPLMFIGIACTVNVIGDLALVAGCRMGAAGAAIATVGAQGLSFLLAILYLRKTDFPFSFRLSEFRIYGEKAKKLLKIGIPVSLQDTLTMLSFLFITAIVNRIGVSASAAVGLSSKISNFTLLPPSAISAAVAAMTAQNIGAGKPKRAVKCLYTGIAVSLLFGTACFLWMHFLPQTAARLFSGDTEVIQASVQYMTSFSFDCLMVCFVFCLNGFFNGCGHTTVSMVNNIVGAFLVRIPVTYVFGEVFEGNMMGIGAAVPLASFCSILIGIVYFVRLKRKLEETQPNLSESHMNE